MRHRQHSEPAGVRGPASLCEDRRGAAGGARRGPAEPGGRWDMAVGGASSPIRRPPRPHTANSTVGRVWPRFTEVRPPPPPPATRRPRTGPDEAHGPCPHLAPRCISRPPRPIRPARPPSPPRPMPKRDRLGRGLVGRRRSGCQHRAGTAARSPQTDTIASALWQGADPRGPEDRPTPFTGRIGVSRGGCSPMPKTRQLPSIVTVDVAYVDYATRQPRGEPTTAERARMADRLVQAAAAAALGPAVRAVRHQANQGRA